MADDHAPPETSLHGGVESLVSLHSPDEDARFHAGVSEGLADLKAGRTVSGEAVLAWMRSWFAENELPPPECGD